MLKGELGFSERVWRVCDGNSCSFFNLLSLLSAFPPPSRWVAYSHVDYSGEQYILEKGFYNNCADWGSQDNRICSIQPILLVRSTKRRWREGGRDGWREGGRKVWALT